MDVSSIKIKESIIKGLPESFERGWGNGYVTIPENHPAYRLACLMRHKDPEYFYFQTNDMMQEITYSEFDYDNNTLTIGFDTAHSYNNKSHDEAYVLAETQKLQEVVDAITDTEVQAFKNAMAIELEEFYKSLYVKKPKIKKIEK